MKTLQLSASTATIDTPAGAGGNIRLELPGAPAVELSKVDAAIVAAALLETLRNMSAGFFKSGDCVRLVGIDHDGLCGRENPPADHQLGSVFDVVRVEPLDPENPNDEIQVLICRQGYGHGAHMYELASYEVVAAPAGSVTR